MKRHDEHARDILVAQALLLITKAFEVEDVLTYSRLKGYRPLPLQLNGNANLIGIIGCQLSEEGVLDYGYCREKFRGSLTVTSDEDGSSETLDLIDYAISLVDGEEEAVLHINDMVDAIADSIIDGFGLDMDGEELADAIRDNDAEVLGNLGKQISEATKDEDYVSMMNEVIDGIASSLGDLYVNGEYRAIVADRPDNGDYSEIEADFALYCAHYSMKSYAESLNMLFPILIVALRDVKGGLLGLFKHIRLIDVIKAYREMTAADIGDYESPEDLAQDMYENPLNFFSELSPPPHLYENIAKRLWHQFLEPLEPLSPDSPGSALVISLTGQQLLDLISSGEMAEFLNQVLPHTIPDDPNDTSTE